MAINKPILGITMGDPAGIGPEILVKVLSKRQVYDICCPLAVGDAQVIKRAVEITGVKLQINIISKVEQALFNYETIDVLDLNNVDIKALEYGKVSAMAGNAAFEAVKKVIELALKKEIDATVTGPLNKEALNLAGHHFAGHTEIYAHFTNTKDYTMMLAEDNLKVVHVSTHVSLRQACDLVKKDRVLRMIRLADNACKQLGIKNPRVGVAGLNPHSGENGMFGWEEQQEIIPAVETAKAFGIDAQGPIPPDTVFSKARGGMYDIVVAMYHDQGHIPLKTIGFRWNDIKGIWESVSGVNITLGLPIVRSSVDHGTAFDLAGKGVATDESLLNAIEYGVKLAVSRYNVI